MTLTRRAALQLLGVAALPAVARAGLPDAVTSAAAHRRALATPPALFRADERALVAAVADGILPRSATPGALDVGVPAFVEVIVGEWMTDEERTEFRAGLAAMEMHVIERLNRPWPALSGFERSAELAWLAEASDPTHPARRGYRRLRSHVLHGYLTSERVQREVLKVDITPGRYYGCTPIPSPLDFEDGADG
ncbi:MAG: gluconate 2-dehydrogenase subunit 3 family protein [Gemmatimonadetes bacterium]|nr:gluconate 2-dehydrogenase subunit 3 family protein [Gemmatimonadota bacterium]